MSLHWRRVAAYVITATLTFAIVAFARPELALAAAGIDQEQPTIDTSPAFSWIIGGPTQQILAQTVTAGATGDLVRVDLPVACPSTDDLVVDIRDVAAGGEPGTTSLSTTTVPGAALPPFPAGGVTFRAITLATALAVTPGTQFAIVLSSTATTSNCSLFPGPIGDSYAGGSAYTDSVDHSSWLCACDVANARADHPFRTWVVQPADLSITKQLHDVDNPGATITYADTTQLYLLTVTNSGPGDATGVQVVDTLPANVTVFSTSSSCANASGTVTCTEALLPSGASTTFGIVFKFNNAGTYTNTASVSASESDPDTSDNTASLTTQVRPTADLQFTQITPSAVVLSPGDTLTYTVSFKNAGPDPAPDIVAWHNIPAGTTVTSISSSQATLCGQESPSNTSKWGCRYTSGLAAGATATMTVTLQVPATQGRLTSNFQLEHVLVAPGATVLDPPLHSSWSSSAWVVSESTQQTVAAGGTATTDNDAELGASENDIVETDVTSPNPGTVSITEQEPTVLPPTGTNWTLLGIEVVISAPAATTAAPLELTFRIDSAFLFGGVSAADLDVYRNNSTTPIGDCATSGTPPSATLPISPDPCVESRTTLGDGDVEIKVLTSQASVWRFSVPSDAPDDGKKDKKHFKKAKKEPGRR